MMLLTLALCLASFLPAVLLPQRPLLMWLALVGMGMLRMLGLRVEGPAFIGILLAMSGITVVLAFLLCIRGLIRHYWLRLPAISVSAPDTRSRDYLLFAVLLLPALLCPMAACLYLPGIGPLLLLSFPSEPQFPVWFAQAVLGLSLPVSLLLGMPALLLRPLRRHAPAWLLGVLLLSSLLAAEHVKRAEIMKHVPESARTSLITQSFLADLREYGHERGNNPHASYQLDGVEYLWSYRLRKFVREDAG